MPLVMPTSQFADPCFQKLTFDVIETNQYHMTYHESRSISAMDGARLIATGDGENTKGQTTFRMETGACGRSASNVYTRAT